MTQESKDPVAALMDLADAYCADSFEAECSGTPANLRAAESAREALRSAITSLLDKLSAAEARAEKAEALLLGFQSIDEKIARFSAQPSQIREGAPTQADFCRYGVCEPGEKHAPGCSEYTATEIAAAAPPEPAAQPMCMCKDRPLELCPGEWESGCDLGANPKFAKRAQPEWGEPVAWMCEFVTADEGTETQFVTEDPAGLRFGDIGQPSPYRVTPLYAAPQPSQPAIREALSEDEIGAAAYRGNTVSYMYDRAKAYGDEILRCWFVLKDAGRHPGRTDDRLSDVLRAALASLPKE